jgi:hypothetical protein
MVIVLAARKARSATPVRLGEPRRLRSTATATERSRKWVMATPPKKCMGISISGKVV